MDIGMRSKNLGTIDPFHVAVIMDGNGRWARARRLPRTAGHRAGARAVRRTVEAAPDLGITTLTLYAFSSDNWKRPKGEIRALMDQLERYLRRESDRCTREGVRINVIGRRDRLPSRVLDAVGRAESATRGGGRLHLRLAVDYSARYAITRAAALLESRQAVAGADFSRLLNQVVHSDPPAPDVDLLIRTSGEQRLSDFLLWECAYAEFVFTPTLWPDFDASDLEEAVRDFRRRHRRFGRVVEAAS